MLDTEEEIAAVAVFKAAVKDGDEAVFWDALDLVDRFWVWRQAFRKIARLPAPPSIRLNFLEAYLQGGDSLRSKVNDDTVLISALRNLLPPYEPAGDLKPIILYRGARREERRYRRYGHSWTDDRCVARSHAKNDHQGDGVVFEAVVPTEAIVSAPWQKTDSFHEREFVVDRRLLKCVRVAESFGSPRPPTQPSIYSGEVIQHGRYHVLQRK